MEYFGFCKGIKELNLPNSFELNFYEGFFADFYDQYVNHDADFSIHMDLIKSYGNNVLELACGSGRVLLPLLKKGVAVDGLDISSDMLEIIKKKSKDFDKNPRLFCCDMINFVSEKKYDVIILAQASLSLLDSQEKRIELFNNVYKNLRPGGIFVFNYEVIDGKSVVDKEKKPIYLFNAKKKSFIIVYEKVIAKENKSVVNLYAEELDHNGMVKRYLTSATKNFLNKSTISSLIQQTRLSKVDEFVFRGSDGTAVFEVVRREDIDGNTEK